MYLIHLIDTLFIVSQMGRLGYGCFGQVIIGQPLSPQPEPFDNLHSFSAKALVYQVHMGISLYTAGSSGSLRSFSFLPAFPV